MSEQHFPQTDLASVPQRNAMCLTPTDAKRILMYYCSELHSLAALHKPFDDPEFQEAMHVVGRFHTLSRAFPRGVLLQAVAETLGLLPVLLSAVTNAMRQLAEHGLADRPGQCLLAWGRLQATTLLSSTLKHISVNLSAAGVLDCCRLAAEVQDAGEQ